MKGERLRELFIVFCTFLVFIIVARYAYSLW
jgi:hypothetical protein